MASIARIEGSMLGGSLAAAGGIYDNGLAMLATGIGGGLAGATIVDMGLPMFGSALGGSLIASSIEEDIIFELATIYGSVYGGSLMNCRMFIDPVEGLNRAYWFEAQAQIDGSISDCGLRDGAAESEWHA